MPPTPQRSGKPLAAAIALACAIAAPVVSHWEGKRNKAYLDRLPTQAVWTICYGSTGPDVTSGMAKTDAECRAMLARDLPKYAAEVAKCTPEIFDRPKVAAAAISLSWNIGANAYCKSTASKRFRAGDYRGGCEALGWFNRSGGRVIQGLVNRRAAEVKLCLQGVGEL